MYFDYNVVPQVLLLTREMTAGMEGGRHSHRKVAFFAGLCIFLIAVYKNRCKGK